MAAALKACLKPLLDGLGMDDDFDLRNSPLLQTAANITSSVSGAPAATLVRIGN